MRTREEKKASLLYNSNGFLKPRKTLEKEMNEVGDKWGKAENPVDASSYKALFNNLKAILVELEFHYCREMERAGMPKDLINIVREY